MLVSTPALEGGISLNRQEWCRKLWHMSGGLIPFLCPLFPHYKCAAEFWGPNVIRLMIVCPAIFFMLLSVLYSTKFTRPGERNIIRAMSCYAVTVLALLVAFPDQLQLGLTVLAVVSFGDGAAGLAGMTIRGRCLPWNSHKTVAGTTGFILVAAPLGTAAYWVCAPAGVTWTSAVAVGSATSIIAAFAESWPSKIDDNLRVGIAAATVVLLNYWIFSAAV
jgi:dolichol kinase